MATTKDTIALTSAQILASNTTAIAALPARAGFGYIVDKVITSWNGGTVQYATNTSLILREVSGDTIATIDLSDLPAADGKIEIDIPVGYTVTEGAALELTEASGNPATGDISVDITIFYDIVQS